MKRSIKNLVVLSSVGLCTVFAMLTAVNNVRAEPDKFYVEAGPAKFIRDHDTAIKKSKESGKPVFAFFQEVPG